MKRFFISLAVLLALVAGSGGSVFAQVGGSASISGIVQDQSRALIPGVSVVATNTGTGIKLTALTNEAGAYVFQSVTPGRYSLTASLPGFRTSTLNDLDIGNVQVRQDFTLVVATTETSVEVTATADALLRESSASIGDVLPGEVAKEMPLVGANVLDLIEIMPGMKEGNFTVIGAFSTDTFTGQYANTVNVTRNGMSVNSGRNDPNIFGLQSTVNINPDLVGEIRLILSPIDPEYRGNAQIQISTRSGTNRYTGSATWRVHNTAFDSNTWANNHDSFTDPTTGIVRNSTPLDWANRHNYTISFGGPIRRNRTFFFASWDHQISRSRNHINALVFTDTARMGIYRYFQGWNPANPIDVQTPITGNLATQVAAAVDIFGNPTPPPDGAGLRCFSVFGNRRYDEGSNALVAITAGDAQQYCPGGTFVFGPSTGTGIWDPLRVTPDQTGYIRDLLRHMPRANAFNEGDGLNTASYSWERGRGGSLSGGNAAALADPNGVSRKQFTLKIDENITQQHRLAGDWSIERSLSATGVTNWPDALYGSIPGSPQTFTSNLTSTLSASLLNEFRFGLRLDKGQNVPPWQNADQTIRDEAMKWFLPAGTNAALGSYSPSAPGTVNYLAAVNAGLGGVPGNDRINSTAAGSGHSSPLWTFADTLSFSKGRHNFKMGGEIRLARYRGYSNDSFPTVALGAWPGNQTPLSSTGQFSDVLPGFLAQAAQGGGTAARTVASNMLYLLTGSVSSATTNYWINSAADAQNGVWQDIATTGKRFRSQVANDYALFFKDDWKLSRRLTLNLGLRWEGYPSPYIKEGFTSRIANQAMGLFGVHQPGDPNNLMADWLESPGRIYLSGYGSSVPATSALACTLGTANPNGIPASTCDPSLLTASEFVGPNTPNPDKAAIPPAWANFAPSIGFAWNVPWFGEGKTTMRGGFGMSYITPGRNGTNLETVLGNAPGATISGTFNSSDPQFQPIISSGRLPNLTDTPLMVPVRPNRAPGLPLPITGRTFLANTQAWDPNYKLPYVMNANMSITRQLRRNMTLDVRYVGSFQRRRDITFDLNTYNVFYNPELFQALVDARAGSDPVLLDQMLAGLSLQGTGTGYGPVGTVVNGVVQRGAAHLRRNATFTNNLANGNFVGVVASLYNLSATTGASTLQALPTGVSGVGGRIQRNGCDRMANGFTHVQQTAPGVFTAGFNASNATPLRCFPEDYMITNPQFSGLAGGTSSAMLHTNQGYNNYNALQTEFTLRPTQGTSFQATWAFEKVMDFPAPYFNPTWFIDPKRPEKDYVVNWATTTHDFRVSGTFELPIGPNRLLFGNASGWVARLLERWTVSIIERNTSGLPRDLYGAQMMFRPGGGDRPYPRPDIVGPWIKPNLDPTWIGDAGWIYGAPDLYTNFRDPQCTNDVANGPIASNPDSLTGTNPFNFGASCTLSGLAAIVPSNTPGAYALPDGRFAVNVLQNSKPGTQGNFPHSKMQLPRRQTLDANIAKSFRLTESKSLQVRVDATNVLNHPNWNEPTLSIQSSNFGRTTGKGGPGNRVIQGQLRVMF
jgi:hypothetical protein